MRPGPGLASIALAAAGCSPRRDAGAGDWSHDPAEWDAARDEPAREIVRRTAR